MIGKAKMFLHALFAPNKHVPPIRFEVKWYHKCVLVLVRRIKIFEECPNTLSYYDWLQAKKNALVYWQRTKRLLALLIVIKACLYVRKLDDDYTKELVKYREEHGLPKIPRYILGFSTKQYFHEYNTEFPDNYPYT